jgi:hypothetical protein
LPLLDSCVSSPERRNAEIVACLSKAELQSFDQLLDRLVVHAREAPGATNDSGD